MLGADKINGPLFRHVDAEDRIPARHPPRPVKRIVDDALARLDGEFARLRAAEGRPWTPPERPICASLTRILFSARFWRKRTRGTAPALTRDLDAVKGFLVGKAMASLISVFRQLPDPRRGDAQRHDLVDTRTIALVASVCGAGRCADVAAFAEDRERPPREFLRLEHGLPEP